MSSEARAVAWFDDWVESRLAQGRLEAEGIDCWLEESSVQGSDWLHPDRPGGIVLLVEPAQAETAKALLNELESAFEPEVPEALAGADRHEECPECGSVEKRFERRRPIDRVFAVLSPSRARRYAGPRWLCLRCGHRWMAQPDG
jgi:hypothetical protein